MMFIEDEMVVEQKMAVDNESEHDNIDDETKQRVKNALRKRKKMDLVVSNIVQIRDEEIQLMT